MQEMTLEEYKQLVDEQVQDLLDVVASMAVGNLDIDVAIPEGIGGITDLAIGLSFLVEDFRELLAEQEKARVELELRVAERTKELEQALAEVQTVHRRYIRQEWQTYSDNAESHDPDIEPALLSDKDWLSTIKQAVDQKEITVHADDQRSTIAIPLSYTDEMIGILGFEGEQTAEWDEQKIAALETLAEQVGLTLENQRLFDQTQAVLAEVRLLYETSRALAAATNPDEALRGVLATLNQNEMALGADSVTLTTVDIDEQGQPEWNEIAAWWFADGREPPYPTGTRFPLKDAPMTNIWIKDPGNPIFFSDTQTDEKLDDVSRQWYLQAGTLASVLMPLTVAGRWVGLLSINWTKPYQFSDQDRRVYRNLMRQFATTLDNQRLAQQTQTTLAEQQQVASLLDKRVRELNCLNELGREIAETPAIPRLLQWITERIPLAMQYPHLCIVAIEYNDQLYGRPEAIDMPTQIVNALRVGGQVMGRIYIAYSEKHDFLDEESALLGGIATRLGGYIESRQFLIEMERLASIVENHPDFIGSGTLDGKALYINPAGLKMMKLPLDHDVTKMSAVDFYLPEDALMLMETGIPTALKEGFWSAEASLLTADGATIPVEETIGINLDADKQPIGFSITMRDITERKQVEEALRLSEARHRVLLNAIPDLIIRLRRDGTYLDVKTAKDFPALAPSSELIGKNMHDILPPELAQQRQYYIDKALQTGEIQIYEHRLIRDGQESHEEIRVVPGGDDEALMMIRDVTDRRLAEMTLRENQKQLTQALDIAKLATWEFDFESSILTLNDRFYTIFRTTAEQVGGYMLSAADYAKKFIHPDDAHQIAEQIGAALETDDPNFISQFEYRIIRADGEEGHVVVEFSIEKDREGKTIKASGIVQDITERKQAELEREQLLTEVQAAYRQYVQREWAQFLEEHRPDGSWRVEHQQIESRQDIASLDTKNNGHTDNHGTLLAKPISLRGQTIGSLSLEDIDPDRRWTAEEIVLVETVSEQLALTVENLRLFGDTQQRAAREQLTREITEKMRSSPDIDTIIETGLTELAQALGVTRTYVKLGPNPEQIEMSKADIEQTRARLKRYGHKK